MNYKPLLIFGLLGIIAYIVFSFIRSHDAIDTFAIVFVFVCFGSIAAFFAYLKRKEAGY